MNWLLIIWIALSPFVAIAILCGIAWSVDWAIRVENCGPCADDFCPEEPA